MTRYHALVGYNDLEMLCEQGQAELMQTHYLRAAGILAEAEGLAWAQQAFDALARLYLPLQEARRQIRQRCGEGAVRMHLFPLNQNTILNLPEKDSHGQWLVGGWGSIIPAVEIRNRAAQEQRYLETFLAAIYPVENAKPVVAIVPLAGSPLPNPEPRPIDQLTAQLPPHCLIFSQQQLPPDFEVGNSDSFAAVMGIWEKLHSPFLAAADRESDPIQRMQAYRLVLQVDPACELAHQHLADVARKLARS